MISKLLIANRGEIAVRIIRGAREMGVKTVAVYSEADRHALHTALADEAVCIGDPEPAKSYLDGAAVIEAAKTTGADAIHPGYGFLSERADFAQACADAGITFVGPSAEAMRKLGAKIDAKKLAVQAGVPVTPGYFEPGATHQDLLAAAQQIGFPVMLKASAGGGGRGMRIVRNAEDFLSQAAMASDEALKGFGDGAMMVEKLIEKPRHIEAQILADSYGNVAILFERECSIQRRHQKLIEEAPSPAFASGNLSTWETLRESVTALVRLSGYTGAGTAEFMFDEATRGIYFLEVNARLQVEHPVTEAITGVDLVKQQIRIASGLPLEVPGEVLAGDRKAIQGHAIEARIVAEDPAKGFLPSIGKIMAWAEPKAPGVRVDTGFGPNGEISRFYDSLVAKVVSYAPTRSEAIAKLRFALCEFHVLGVKTNIAFLLDVLDHPDFASGVVDTDFLNREFSDWTPNPDIPGELADIIPFASTSGGSEVNVSSNESFATAWGRTDNFRVS